MKGETMDSSNFPTKRNLIDAKHSLQLARKGHDLLDKKRQVLFIELNAVKNTTKRLTEKFKKASTKAHESLALAHKSMGISHIDRLSQKIPLDNEIKIYFRSIMGVIVPQVNTNKKYIAVGRPPFDLGESMTYLDESYEAWIDVKMLALALAETKTTVNRLKAAMRHTQKRASALKNIIIPKYETRIKYISEQLEERERDELVRVRASREYLANTE